MAANPLSLDQLALEILLEIASNTTIVDQLCLSRTSRIFNSVATKTLYRHIELTSFRRIFRCCTTLEKSSEAALSVRTLSFDLLGHSMMSYRGDASVFAPFFRRINAALFQTTLLRSLILRLLHDRNGAALHRCTFPFLGHFGSSFKDGGDFVSRHPMITNITVLDEGLGIPTFNPAHIPSLAVFSGPAHLVPAIIPGRPVHSAKLWWPLLGFHKNNDTDSWNSPAIIRGLAQSTAPDGLMALENLFLDWPPLLTLASLGTSLTLRGLFIRSRNIGSSAYVAFLTEFVAVLPEFKQLYELGINFLHGGEVSPQFHRDEAADLEEEFWTIHRWVSLCPTMHAAKLD
ncbi:hypothetical protein DFH07DRAFT_807324 [Mycena maculata]|uniref:F-box domain-containing protein n=1 Tax=Mycena maculata TaxID=230809 RepID=A0AAD7NN98_9AGAR|nr:hypothetical protein DFH07DRAFT_807324 [Mycena maculata]